MNNLTQAVIDFPGPTWVKLLFAPGIIAMCLLVIFWIIGVAVLLTAVLLPWIVLYKFWKGV